MREPPAKIANCMYSSVHTPALLLDIVSQQLMRLVKGHIGLINGSKNACLASYVLWQLMMNAAGSEAYTQAVAGEIDYASNPAFQDAVQKYIDLVEAGAFSEASLMMDRDECEVGVFNGTVPMYYCGTWVVQQFYLDGCTVNPDDVVIMSIPSWEGCADENCRERDLLQAADMIWDAQEHGNRIHVTGIGKPGHIAGYYASLLSSTGTPAYFLHGTEAVHGSCGQLVKGDVVICISNSGETQEMKVTCEAIRRNGCAIIGVSGNPESWLARFADAHLTAHAFQEGGPLDRAPRLSILAETYVLQALSVILQDRHHQTPAEYVLRHPGGKLGEFRDGESKA